MMNRNRMLRFKHMLIEAMRISDMKNDPELVSFYKNEYDLYFGANS